METNLKSAYEFSSSIRQCIYEETSVLNNRMNWLLVSQGLLFTALGMGFSEGGGFPSIGFTIILSTTSILLSLSTYASFIRNEASIHHILNNWNHFLQVNNLDYHDFPPVFCGTETVLSDYLNYLDEKRQTTNKTKRWFRVIFSQSYKLIPLIFVLSWLIACLYIILNS